MPDAKNSIFFGKQPRGLYIISLSELMERFSYYGTQTILVLYLIKVFAFSDDASYSLYGAYAALAYGLPVLGGMLADRFIGFPRAIIAGATALILGNILLAIPNFTFFCIGLAVNICGIGLYKANTAALVGTLYDRGDTRRERGYILFYLAMNIGATLGPLLYGLITQGTGWRYGFIASAIGTAIGLFIFIVNQRDIVQKHSQSYPRFPSMKINLNIIILLLISTFFITLLFFYPKLLSNFLIIFAITVLSIIVFIASKHSPIERNRIFALLILSSFVMCFFAASLQSGSSVNLFIQRDVNRTLFGWNIPALVFAALYPLAVVILAPIITPLWNYLSRRNCEPSAPIKVLIGLLLVSAAFVGFMLAANSSKQALDHESLWWICIGNLCLGAGELCITPASLAVISRLSPLHLQGTLIGIWFLFVALGGYLSGVLAKISNQSLLTTSREASIAIYQRTFLTITIITASIAILLLLLLPLIKRLMVEEEERDGRKSSKNLFPTT